MEGQTLSLIITTLGSAAVTDPATAFWGLVDKTRVNESLTGGPLFEAYANDPSLMGDDWSSRLPREECATIRHIGDYIAGMTDGYAEQEFARVTRP